ncbi:caspase family protein [Spirosoma sp.]|uniref:caspase family protein n=1 Tax=Spirosoma sp. TaxID=1899569 RepID=UPI002631C6A7|nr:caspase family protein [Spirosoma sp.]MCX6216972.1 caspase family protein [Spirosoma sp.]
MKFFPFLLTALLSFCWLPIQAQRTYAVIVGVSDYQLGRPGKGDLTFSDDDAELFYRLLRSPMSGSIPSENIILLTNSRASRANIMRAMTLFQQATPRDRIIFYFSGHGAPGMLLPYDYTPDARVTLYDRDVKAAFRQSAARTKLLLADACMAGTMRNRQYPSRPPAVSSSTDNSTVVVLLSSRNEETSREGSNLQQGFFTHYLVKGATGDADINPRNGIVTIKELYDYVRQGVRQESQNQQTPVAYGRFPENLPFSTVKR